MDNVKIKIDDKFKKKLDKAADEFPFKLHKALILAVRLAHTRASRRVHGPVLKVQSNWLAGSLQPFIRSKGKDTIQAGLYTLAWYAKLHEYGLGKAKKRPFLHPSLEEGRDRLYREIELWK